jgi:Bacterial protein of unknown function (DUF937)/OmpA family
MDTNLQSLFTQTLSPELMQTVSKNLGETEPAVRKGIGALVPVILAGLMAKASTPAGASKVFAAVTGPTVNAGLSGVDPGSPPSVTTSSTTTNTDSPLLSDLFGADKASRLASALAGVSGLRVGSAANLILMVVPLLFGFLKRHMATEGLDSTRLGSFLAGQRSHLSGATDPRLMSVLGLGSPASMSGAAATSAATAVRATALPRWLPLLLGALILLGLLWYFFGRSHGTAPSSDRAAATAEVSFPAKVYFETGKAEVGSESSAVIRAAAAALAKRNAPKVAVTGYTDRTGDEAANRELAKNRAMAVKAALEAAGVNSSRIESKEPVFVEIGAGGADAEARRVDITLP